MALFRVASQGAPCCKIETGDTGFTEAALALGSYLSRITGAVFPSEGKLPGIRFRIADHGQNGFARFLEGQNLILESRNSLTAQYAVYDLLEALAGCRFYTSSVEFVPSDPDLVLVVEKYAFDPILGYREVYYRDYSDPVFAIKRKVSPSGRHENWGFWCHSFSTLIPSRVYYKDHPEYFALIDGKRDPQGQLCLSNPEVLTVLVENLRRYMDESPDCLYWSVSQDDHDRYCRCPDCQALNDADGTPMGSILNFVNQVAAFFPDKIISTLAYWYSRKAPKYTRPAENVHIMLCNIDALRGEPLEHDPRNHGTVQELLDWSSICEHVFLWDYNIQFANLVSPFPNLRTLAPNMRFFAEHSVRSIFSQCNREIGGEMSELRGYLLSRLCWNPYEDPRMITEDFLHGYYGKAAPFILHYLETLHDASHDAGLPLGIFHGPRDARSSFLTEPLVSGYQKDFDDAEAAVADCPEILDRVRVARLPVIYAQLRLRYGSREERRALVARFARDARICGLEKVEEWHITVDQFVTDILASLEYDGPSFSRASVRPLQLLGIIDPYPEKRLPCHSLFASYEHALRTLHPLLDMPAVGHNFTFWSFPESGGRFMGIPMRPGAPKDPVAGFSVRRVPAMDCVTVRCETEDLDLAIGQIPDYLAKHGLLQNGEILDRESRMGIHTLHIPVVEAKA